MRVLWESLGGRVLVSAVIHSFNNHLLNQALCWPQGLLFSPRSFPGRVGWEGGLLCVQPCHACVGNFLRGFQSGGHPEFGDTKWGKKEVDSAYSESAASRLSILPRCHLPHLGHKRL